MNKKIIRLSKSIIGEKEKNAVLKVLEKEYLGMGSEVMEFEKNLEEFFDKKVVCVTNGTAALQLALQACGIGKGDEVLIQSLTYVASIQAISATGAKPVFCDISEESITLDINTLKENLTSNTKAIVPVHYAGGVGDLESIYKFAKENNLQVIEDAAHAFGSIYKNIKIGTYGHVTCFSFDGIKNITSGEGGCIVSNDLKIIEKIKDARLLGVQKDTEARYKNQRSWEFDVNSQGWRYHMSNIMASIGIVQLKRFNEFRYKRNLLSNIYLENLKGNSNINLLKLDKENIVMHIFPIILNNPNVRDKLREFLNEKNIQTGVHYFPNHYLTLYKNNVKSKLPITEYLYPRLLTLPLHPDLSNEDIEYVIYYLKLFFRNNAKTK